MNDKQLRDELIMTIARYYPFSIDDVGTVYDMLGSIDATIKICETAVSIGAFSPVYVVKMMRSEYNLEPEEKG